MNCCPLQQVQLLGQGSQGLAHSWHSKAYACRFADCIPTFAHQQQCLKAQVLVRCGLCLFSAQISLGSMGSSDLERFCHGNMQSFALRSLHALQAKSDIVEQARTIRSICSSSTFSGLQCSEIKTLWASNQSPAAAARAF